MDAPAPPVEDVELSTAQAAELIGCSPRTVNEMVLRKEIVGHKRNPNRVNSPLRISRASVQGFIQARDGAGVVADAPPEDR